MGLKGLMYRNLVDMQKEYIESLLEQLRHKNEFIIKETKRANELFKLSYKRKLKIEEQQDEINRLKEMLSKAQNTLKFYANEDNFGGESSFDCVYERNPDSDLYDDFRDVGWYAKKTLNDLNSKSEDK